MMAERVRITDVSPRDGLQNEAGVVPAAEKVGLVRRVCAAGVDEVEVTSFVSPRWVPQLADAGEVLGALRDAPPSPRGRGAGGEGGFIARGMRASRQDTTCDRARKLRGDATVPERVLWGRLRGDQIHGERFRRQHPIGPFIADFYCPAARLVIELDGDSHEGRAAHVRDHERSRWLQEQGVHVERFTNSDVGKDIDAVVERIGQLVEQRRRGLPLPRPLSLWEREGDCVYSALVPNAKGFERFLEFYSEVFPLKLAVFTAASETFSQRNTNASIAETVERFLEFVPRAVGMGIAVRVYVSCVIACPFEGAIAPGEVKRVCDSLRVLAHDEAWGSGQVEFDLGDTIGAGTGASTRALLGEFDEGERGRMTLHLHDTFGKAAECVREGLEMGVRSFDGSVAGLGGCPYAGTKEKPAPGNVSTEVLVETAEAEGFVTGVDREKLEEAAAYAREIVSAARLGAGS